MYHPRVKGTYYEMGHAYGTILHNHGFKISEQSGETLQFWKESKSEVKRIFPEIIEEIKGFADACHCPYAHLAAFMVSIGVLNRPMCSAFAAFNGADIILGRNYDFYYRFKKYIESYLTCPQKGFWSIGHTDVFIGREDGINEKGLGIAMIGVPNAVVRPGINFPLITRYILDKCCTVEEAITRIRDRHFSTSSNYLLADKKGDMAAVEASPEKVKVRRPRNGEPFIVCTNHFMHPEMQDRLGQKKRAVSNGDTLSRYTTIYGMLKEKEGKINVKDAEKILSDHTELVCAHQREFDLGTLWSLIAVLKGPKILRAEGSPCRATFKEDLRLKKALQKREQSESTRRRYNVKSCCS
jgi:predicted choloylglycine hydrolase